MKDASRFFLGTQKGVRVYRGKDDQWDEVGLHLSGVADCVEGSKSHPELIFCGILHDGLYRSCDAGAGWARIFEGDVRSVAVDPANDDVVYVGTEPVHLYRSDDRGDHWEELKGLLDLSNEVRSNWISPQPEHDGHVRHIQIDVDRPQSIYLSIEHGGIVRSLDHGKTWEDISRGIDYLDIHKVWKRSHIQGPLLCNLCQGVFSQHGSDPGMDANRRTRNHTRLLSRFHLFGGRAAGNAHRDGGRISRALEPSRNGSVRDFPQLGWRTKLAASGRRPSEKHGKDGLGSGQSTGKSEPGLRGIRAERQRTSGNEKDADRFRGRLVLSGPGRYLARN